jgi:hypothetical protein
MRSLAAAALVLAIAALGLYAFRQQQAANREILSRLDDVRSTLRDQTRQSTALANQVTALSERVERLEIDNRDLRRQLARLMNRKPIEVAAIALPLDTVASAKVSHPLDAVPLAPLAEHSLAEAEPVLIETIPITWATDWSSYQPAGIIAPPAPIELQRKLTDPVFVKKMYYSFAALQAVDAATTLAAVSNGAREANPLLQGAVQSPPAIIAIKAGVVAGTIFTLERLRKDHPVVAVATLIAINSTLAVVAINNASVNARQKE